MSKKKVMVIDDEPDFLSIVKANLEATNNYEVKTLPTAKELISEVYSFEPDVILLDMLMPAVGGVEACAMLNNDPVGKNIPIIIISALFKDQDKYSAYKEGINDYLVKPVGKNDLIAAIERAIGHQH
ncbi:response regulator [bacterium]|nr:MAG: response regulator [bacterium]